MLTRLYFRVSILEAAGLKDWADFASFVTDNAPKEILKRRGVDRFDGKIVGLMLMNYGEISAWAQTIIWFAVSVFSMGRRLPL